MDTNGSKTIEMGDSISYYCSKVIEKWNAHFQIIHMDVVQKSENQKSEKS